jgi:hypothetical protein
MHASLHAVFFSFKILTKTRMGKQTLMDSNVKLPEKFTSSQVMQTNKCGTARAHIFCNVHYQCNKKIPLPEQV